MINNLVDDEQEANEDSTATTDDLTAHNSLFQKYEYFDQKQYENSEIMGHVSQLENTLSINGNGLAYYINNEQDFANPVDLIRDFLLCGFCVRYERIHDHNSYIKINMPIRDFINNIIRITQQIQIYTEDTLFVCYNKKVSNGETQTDFISINETLYQCTNRLIALRDLHPAKLEDITQIIIVKKSLEFGIRGLNISDEELESIKKSVKQDSLSLLTPSPYFRQLNNDDFKILYQSLLNSIHNIITGLKPILCDYDDEYRGLCYRYVNAVIAGVIRITRDIFKDLTYRDFIRSTKEGYTKSSVTQARETLFRAGAKYSLPPEENHEVYYQENAPYIRPISHSEDTIRLYRITNSIEMKILHLQHQERPLQYHEEKFIQNITKTINKCTEDLKQHKKKYKEDESKRHEAEHAFDLYTKTLKEH